MIVEIVEIVGIVGIVGGLGFRGRTTGAGKLGGWEAGNWKSEVGMRNAEREKVRR
jgi:hypothetical protein